MGLTAEQVALEIGVTKKTLYNWLKDKKVTEAVNKIAVSNLDAVIPKLASQTEKLINSNKSSDIKLGMESFFKIKEQLEKKEALNNKTLEMQKFERGAEIMLNYLPKIFKNNLLGQKLAIELYANTIIQELRLNPNDGLTEVEINNFLYEHGI